MQTISLNVLPNPPLARPVEIDRVKYVDPVTKEIFFGSQIVSPGTSTTIPQSSVGIIYDTTGNAILTPVVKTSAFLDSTPADSISLLDFDVELQRYIVLHSCWNLCCYELRTKFSGFFGIDLHKNST